MGWKMDRITENETWQHRFSKAICKVNRVTRRGRGCQVCYVFNGMKEGRVVSMSNFICDFQKIADAK